MNWNSPFEAFTYMFKDNKYFAKFGVFFIVALLGISFYLLLGIIEEFVKSEVLSSLITLLLMPIAMIFQLVSSLVMFGYSCACIKSLSEQKANFILPFFNFKKDMMLGLKAFAGLLLLETVLMVVLFVVAIVLAIIAAIAFGIGSSMLSIFVALIFGIILIILSVLTLFYLPAAIKLFSLKQDPLAFFSFEEIIRSIDENSEIYYKYVGVMILAGIVSVILTVLSVIPGVLLSTIFPVVGFIFAIICICFIGAYITTVSLFLTAKCTRQQAVVEQQII